MPKDEKDNGIVTELEPGISLDILARFNPAESIYITQKGHTLKFRAISAGLVDRAQIYFEGLRPKPEMPIIILDHGKGRTSERGDPNDAAYLVELAEWNTVVYRELNMWLFANGIEIDLPKKPEVGSLYAASLKLEASDVSDDIKKYLYIISLINTEEFSFLGEVIIGNKSVTQAGLQQAAEDFPS